MASKATLIAAIVTANLPGLDAASLQGKTVADLEALASENGISLEVEKVSKSEVKRADDDPRTGKMVKCRIEPGHGPGGKDPVFGCVNGYNFYAKRGVEIELDEGFIKHLEGVVVGDVVQVVDEKTGKPTGELEVLNRKRFQITIL